ncbi:sulfurtransferase-like selenium metabolism protein YedF [Clostridia bacterium]|nr:sulfurtransferase-like selenium metabolism protein YedF [Clostridia bacterium]
MQKSIDARGMSCPMPVVATKKALEALQEGVLEVLVDNEVARDNVIRYANSSGYEAASQEKSAGYAVSITKKISATTSAAQGIFAQNQEKPLVFLIKSKDFGEGDPELGRVLMRSFLFTLQECDEPIKAIVFMNSAVYLTLDDSEVLGTISNLEKKGAEILSCGTCLDFYNVKERLAVGSITNMYSAVDHLLKQGVKTITI